MTQQVIDRVIAAKTAPGDVTLRMRDWTPSGGYEALTDAALQAGIDIDAFGDGDEVGLAKIEYKTDTGDEYGRAKRIVDVEFLDMDADEFYADVAVCFQGQLRLPVVEGAEHLEPSEEDWTAEVREIISEGVMDVYLEMNNPHVHIEDVFRD